MKNACRYCRILLFSLLALCLLLGMVGCHRNDPTPTPPEEQPKEEIIQLFLDGATAYSVVRPEIAGSDLKKAAASLTTTLRTETGAKDLAIREDYVKRGEEVPTDTPEILIGLTNRQESIDAHKILSENQYTIAMVGNRLVIIGYDEPATVQAINYFLTVILKENLTDAKSLALPQGFLLNNSYIPPVVNPFGEDLPIFPIQNRPTVSPATYLLPTYTLKNGMYIQTYGSFDLQGIRTTFQTNTGYADNYAINTDSVMVYDKHYNGFSGWYAGGNYTVDMMIAVNRCDKVDIDKYGLRDSIQTNANGDYLEHGAGTSYYMVPSEGLIDYIWETMLEPVIIACHPQTIALEEPEMWHASGYSKAFKAEWEAYYHEPWQNPSASATNTLKANLLKTYLFERILTELSDHAKKLDPTIQLYIASHSTVSYAAWGITSGLDHYIATGKLDGIIGQTWSDTHNTAFPYRGISFRDNFTNAFIEYSSYVDSVEGINFYALADPMADGTSFTEEDLQYIYRQSITATLMQPEIHRFQVLPWVQRAYANVSSNYRTIQSQIFEVLNQVGGEEITVEAGTPGITFLVADSMSWMNEGNKWALNATNGMYGVVAPLVRDGIPAKMKSMEHIQSVEDLKGVTVLIVSYDSCLPMKEETNIAIAEWVKAGGTLLLLSGANQYFDADDNFFWYEQGSPLNHLLQHMGLTHITTKTVTSGSSVSATEQTLKDAFNGQKISSTYRSFTITFDGTDDAILSLGDDALGINESVGKGQLIAVGLPSAYYAANTNGPEMIRALVEYALDYTDYEYTSSDLMVIRRGDIVATHAYKDAQVLDGTYINLFSYDLSVLIDPTVKKDDSMVLFDISSVDLSVPRLGFSSGTVKEGSLTETAKQITYTVTSAANTILANRILLPSGTYPSSIEITRAESGQKVTILKYLYDAKTNTCLLTFDGSVEETTVTITFGTSSDAMSSIQKGLAEILIPTNNKNLDSKYLVKNTAGVNGGVRFCDNAGEVIYKFDFSDYIHPVYQLYICQNYIVEISPDGKAWTMIADYSQGGTIPRIANANNATMLAVDPAAYEQLDDTLYVRIRNTESVGGHGGAISQIIIRHLVDAEHVPAAPDAPGKNNTSTEKIPDQTSSNEKQYLVSTSNGISTYRRTVRTNSSNQDAEFIDYNTAGMNENIRYCDEARQLVYAFDISDMTAATFTFYLSQNYLFEVSLDGTDFEIIADYSEGGKRPHLTTGGNEKGIAVDVFDYAEEGDAIIYFRLSNTDISKGWGGTISRFVMEYQKPAS